MGNGDASSGRMSAREQLEEFRAREELRKMRGAGSTGKTLWGAGKWLFSRPTAVAEKKGGVLGIIGRWLREIFKYVYGILVIVVILFLLTVGILFAYRWISPGLAGAQITHGVGAIEQGITPLLAQGEFGKVWGILTGERSMVQYGFESEVEKPEKEQGVRIKDVRAGSPDNRFFEGEPVKVYASIEASSPKDIEIYVDCRVKDGLGEGKDMIGVVEISHPRASGNTVRITSSESGKTFSAICTFPEGFVIEKRGMTGKVAMLGAEREIDVKEIEIDVLYNYPSTAYGTIYFMNSEMLNNLIARGEDPFEWSGINDPRVSADRRVSSVASYSPMKLAIGTYQSQPFGTGTKYTFGVSLENDALKWGGELVALKRLDVKLPPIMYTEEESGFGGERVIGAGRSTCAFTYTGSSDADGFKIHTLKDSEKKKLNDRCVNAKEDVVKYFCNVVEYSCEFSVPAYDREGLQWDYIVADADYIYRTRAESRVDIIARPELVA